MLGDRVRVRVSGSGLCLRLRLGGSEHADNSGVMFTFMICVRVRGLELGLGYACVASERREVRRYGLHEQRVPPVAHGLDVGQGRGMVHLVMVLWVRVGIVVVEWIGVHE